MAQESHFILGDKVQVHRRDESRFWQCAASIQGERYRASTGEESLSLAKSFAEDWYIDLRARARAGTLPKSSSPTTFAEAAAVFLREYQAMTQGQRSSRWVEGHAIRLRVHLLPFFGKMPVADITSGTFREYLVHRMTPREEKNPFARDNRPPKKGPPARNTLHNETVVLSLVLKSAEAHGWIKGVPNLKMPYKASGKVSHRPWFSPAEYKQLYTASRKHAKNAAPRFRWEAQQLHDYILFMANTGLRPDEAKNLLFRDIEITHDEKTDEIILVIEVRGKQGIGYCKSMPGAVQPFRRLRKRPKHPEEGRDENEPQNGRVFPETLPQPEDRVFPGNHVHMFNGLLEAANLKFDREGNARTSYSLRHTYICLRLIEEADVFAIAKNCRTSVDMIDRFYARHLKNSIDAGATNKKQPKSAKKRQKVDIDDLEDVEEL